MHILWGGVGAMLIEKWGYSRGDYVGCKATGCKENKSRVGVNDRLREIHNNRG